MSSQLAAQPSESVQEKTPFHVKKTAALCWIGWVFDFYDLILIAFLIPAIEESFHASLTTGSWLIGVGLGASGLGGIVFGWMADQVGRKKVLICTVLLFSIGMLLTALSQSVLQFMIARFITGLGLGGEWAVGHALIAESVPPSTRARWSAFVQSGEPVGVAIAAFMGFIVAPHIGWRNIFMLSSLTGFLALIFMKHISESPMWLNKEKQTSRQKLDEVVPFVKSYWTLMLVAMMLAILKLGTYWTCYTWLPRFISESFGKAIGKSALWIMVGQVGQFIGMHLFGHVADRIGRRWAFTVFSLTTAVALLPLALFWTPLFTQHPQVFWGLLFVMGLGSGCTAGFGALLAEIFPTSQRTFAMGAVYNLARGVQLFSPVLVGLMVTRHGLTGGLLVPTVLAVATAAWVWLLPDRRGETLEA